MVVDNFTAVLVPFAADASDAVVAAAVSVNFAGGFVVGVDVFVGGSVGRDVDQKLRLFSHKTGDILFEPNAQYKCKVTQTSLGEQFSTKCTPMPSSIYPVSPILL